MSLLWYYLKIWITRRIKFFHHTRINPKLDGLYFELWFNRRNKNTFAHTLKKNQMPEFHHTKSIGIIIFQSMSRWKKRPTTLKQWVFDKCSEAINCKWVKIWTWKCIWQMKLQLVNILCLLWNYDLHWWIIRLKIVYEN